MKLCRFFINFVVPLQFITFMKKALLFIVFIGFMSSCSVGWGGKFHKENWGGHKAKKGVKGRNR